MPGLMRLGGLVLVALSLFSSVTAHTGTTHTHAKRQNSATTTGAGGTTQPRLEIRQLQQDADAWNLFILAMQAFQNSNHNDVLSWYSIAGIHGMPYSAWNGVQPHAQNVQAGYCAHSSPLFATWHRPYVALFEQALLNNAQSVVNQFTGSARTRYASALTKLRLPYWDWAEIPPGGNSANTMPQTMSSPTISVTSPRGQQTIQNPLYSYNHFNPHAASDFAGYGGGQWDTWPNTLRYPSSTEDVNAVSNAQQAANAVAANNAQARSQVYRVLTACSNYLEMSDDGASGSDPSCGVNLEAIHNGIHSLVGGGGHMTYNNWAGFDAAFFLHHANVDRLLALWQNLHPNSWMPSANSGNGESFTSAANTRVDGNTPLEPFRGPNGPWTSNNVRDITVFKYTYPELLPAADGSRPNVVESVNNLYGSNAVPAKLNRVSSSSSSSSASPTSTSASSSSSSSGSTSGSSSSASSSASSSSSSGSGGQPGSIGASGSTEGQPRATGGSSNAPSGSGSGTSRSASATTTLHITGANGQVTSTAVPVGGTVAFTGIDGRVSSVVASAIAEASGVVHSIIDGIGSVIGGGRPGAPGAGGAAPTGSGSSTFPQVGGVRGNNSTGNGTGNVNVGPQLTPTGRTHDYTCNIASEKHGLGGTYNVYAFIGEGPSSSSSPKTWISHPNFCGIHAVFAPLGGKIKQGHLSTGQLVLTTSLAGKVADGELNSLDEADVLPYLKDNLNWKVALGNQEKVVDNSQVPGLTVAAMSQKIMPASDANSLPSYAPAKTNNEVTHGKDGGIQDGMQYNWWDVCAVEDSH